ncbi:MAG: hypothetical protein ABSF71_24115 [Terriglobia bacterium]
MRVLTSSQFDLRAVRSPLQYLRTVRPKSWQLAAVISAILLLACVALAQQEEKPKIPGLDKIIAANEHLMFTGTVKSVDEKHSVMSIDAEGGTTEIFPIKHSTHVETADGFRKKLDALSPGTRVMVYYDQRADRRTVTRIELFASESKKKEPQP